MTKPCKHLKYDIASKRNICAKGYAVKSGCSYGLMLCHEAKEENEDE